MFLLFSHCWLLLAFHLLELYAGLNPHGLLYHRQELELTISGIEILGLACGIKLSVS
jgi:hypothetical protein